MNKFFNTMQNTSRKVIGTLIGKITSVSKDGKTVNSMSYQNAEVRNLKIMLPYGISSSGLDNLPIQIIVNDSNNNAMVGVFDKLRPVVKPGEVIIYSKYGQYIKLMDDGDIKFITNDENITLSSLMDRIRTLEDQTHTH